MTKIQTTIKEAGTIGGLELTVGQATIRDRILNEQIKGIGVRKILVAQGETKDLTNNYFNRICPVPVHILWQGKCN